MPPRAPPTICKLAIYSQFLLLAFQPTAAHRQHLRLHIRIEQVIREGALQAKSAEIAHGPGERVVAAEALWVSDEDLAGREAACVAELTGITLGRCGILAPSKLTEELCTEVVKFGALPVAHWLRKCMPQGEGDGCVAWAG